MQEHLNKNRAKGQATSAIRLDISVLRLLGCLMIVWYHAGLPYHEFAYSGLVVFIVISIYLLRVSSAHSASIWGDSQKRARRILLPWAFWSFVYGIFLLQPGKSNQSSISEIFTLLLAGTSIHLWYLPFIWIVLFLVQLLIRYMHPLGIWLVCEATIFLGLLTSPFWRLETASFGAPWGQYLHASLAVSLGVALLVGQRINQRLALIGMLANFLAALCVVRVPGVGVPYAVGALISIALMRRIHLVGTPPWLTTLANATFGVYLTHILFLRWVWRCGEHGEVGYLMAVLASFAFVVLARRMLPIFRELT